MKGKLSMCHSNQDSKLIVRWYLMPLRCKIIIIIIKECSIKLQSILNHKSEPGARMMQLALLSQGEGQWWQILEYTGKIK